MVSSGVMIFAVIMTISIVFVIFVKRGKKREYNYFFELFTS